ncbi:hypothetical protein GCM10017600_25870 [Streptosporangium carneum]|uniref:Tn3 transposase DDE domain-containing protein n=1 Tax=Streptosporangium carneum TaxID=47481 RepID=A0A9W6HZI1_9ACTN|nr:hypothetical protein GCM10017600_25870 [Streptosporangium carneum]
MRWPRSCEGQERPPRSANHRDHLRRRRFPLSVPVRPRVLARASRASATADVARLRAEGHDIEDEDVARLSPLKDRRISFLGRYLFNVKAGGPFQDPDAVEDDED